MNCRHCGLPLEYTFLDLGFAPPSNAYLTREDLVRPELYYPLKVNVCQGCWLVQSEDYAQADALFKSDYAYFSSTSSTWLAHASEYSERMIAELNLDSESHVIELASNDGYLLQNFVAVNIPCLGIEPTASTATVAASKGIPVLQEFFGEALGMRLNEEGLQADLIAANNVYAHVPDINDFTRGIKAALKPGGVITLEFPHLLNLLTHTQFDTVYHEHFSYLSLSTVSRIFEAANLRVWDVETLSTHGGSLRVFGCHGDDHRPIHESVGELLAKEVRAGLERLSTYQEFQSRAEQVKNDFLGFLILQKQAGKTVAGYGAAAKGNTLLNFAGVKSDLLPFICDAAAAKQGKFMPGSHIPIVAPDELKRRRPDFVIIVPWNIAAEVRQQNAFISEWGGQFVTAVPKLSILS